METKIIAGRYRILELIGSGGMANVYKATDEVSGKTVALKTLKDENRQDADFVRRFENEAKAVLSLSHPNIVRSYDVVEDGDETYIVLEYVEGRTLKQLIKDEGALPPKLAVGIATQILDALEHAHSRGFIHRDVKPQNVIINSRGRAKLTDFGIAKDAAHSTRTFAGTNVIGSVHYLSPEQAKGDDVTAESDIYSCAMTVYEMLTGQVPFGGDNSVTIALKHLQEEIVPPRELNSKIPRALSDVVVKAASKKPSQRYPSAHDMKMDLQRALREPNGHFARVTQESAKKKKHRFSLANIVIVVFIIIGLFAAMFFMLRAWRDSDLESEEFIIPTVLNKTVQQATDVAQLRGFKLVVEATVPSDEYAEGMIITQTPASGTVAVEGTTIVVTVSEGGNFTDVPDLKDKTFSEAMIALSDAGLEIGEVYYDDTSEIPDGLVFKQTPGPGESIFLNDEVDIWVSGAEDMSEEMPTLTGKTLNEAITAAAECGFTKIWIRTAAPENGNANTKEEMVFKQNPAASTSASRSSCVEIWVYRSFLGLYSTDVAFNIDVENTDKNIAITAQLANGAQIVLYETILQPGKQQPVVFTAYLPESGEYECIVYENGIEIRRNVLTFSQR